MSYKIILIALILIFISTISAQQERRAESFDTDMQQLERSNEQMIPQRQLIEPAMEKAIDSTDYILGPGDQLLIKIWGPLENQFVTEITPEGYVIIPTISEVKVSGLSLAEGITKIQAELSSFFRDAGFSVRLVRMRKFRVFVVGEVRNSGTYYLRAADRVSDAIQLAGGLIQWGDDTRIQVRHTDTTTDTVNISNFYLHGELSENPHLQGGDVIYIPPINLKENYVVIEGNVGSEGIYQFRENETLFDFLTRIRAINRKSNVDEILLFRKSERQVFDLLSADSGARTEELQTGDRIIVPTNRDRVYVKGEVLQPGSFPYLANYTARDYAGFAGIMDTAKGVDAIYVIRSNTGKVEKGKDVVVKQGDIVVVPQRPREIFKDYMTILTPIISIGISAFALIQSSK